MDNNQVELKAGHPPAAKIGGRRVPQKREKKTSEASDRNSYDEDDYSMDQLIDTNLPAKMERCYPTAAVRQAHYQPKPAREITKMPHEGKLRQPHQPRRITH